MTRATPLLHLLLAAGVLGGSGCVSERAAIAPEVLAEHKQRAIAENHAVVAQVQESIGRRLDEDLAAGRRPTIDILVLSGGADWGAFGAGFLNTWSQRSANEPLAMPDFALVTGISTGALIAPYAGLGLHRQIDEVYRNSSPEWSESRFFSSLFSGTGLFDISELEKMMNRQLDELLIPGLLAEGAGRRRMVVATVDLDLGILRVWDLGTEARRDPARVKSIERAAIAIPAAFDPVVVDGTLQADAGVLMQMVGIAQPKRIAEQMRGWNTAHPQAPVRLRYWLIANNRTGEPPTTVQPTWHELLNRSMAMTLKSGVAGPISTLWLQSEVLRRDGLDVEFRWIAIPVGFDIDTTVPPFDQRTTRKLSDLGRSLGAEPDPWLTSPPLPIGDIEEVGAVGSVPAAP